MPRFVFKLQAALAMREREERAAQRDLAERLRDADGLRRTLQQLNDDLVTAQADLRAGGLLGPIRPEDLAAHRRYTNDVARRGHGVMSRIAHADQAVAQARAKLADRTTQRRVLERLRERQYEAFRADAARRELNDADEDAGRWTADVAAGEADAEAYATAAAAGEGTP